MKKYMKSSVLITLLLLLTSCSNSGNTSVNINEEEIVPVNVIEAKTSAHNNVLSYIGNISPEQMKKLSFKTAGKINKIYVQKGQRVKRGAVMATMDTADYQIGKEAAAAQLQGANIKSGTAKDLYDYALEQFNKTESLHKENAVSDDVYEQAKTNLKVRADDMSGAEELRKQAEAQYNSIVKNISDSSITASEDGVVAEILYKDNEIVAAGYPVIAMRSENQIVTVGVSSKDIDKITMEMNANISYLDKKSKGKITYISEIPNMETLSYDVEITLDENVFRMGNIVDVEIVMGHTEGIWVPIDVLQYEGKSFIYTVENGKAVKKYVEVVETDGSSLRIEGIGEKSQIISKNMSYIKDGGNVKIINE